MIANKDARYSQKKHLTHGKRRHISLFRNRNPGWSPDGNNFSYAMVRLKNEIYMDGELVFDHIKLQPDVQDVNGLGFMEEYTRIGSFIVISEEILEEKRQFRGSFFKTTSNGKQPFIGLIGNGNWIALIFSYTQKYRCSLN